MIGATLFSGIGAPETAIPHWQWAWCAEIEPFPCAVLAARHGASRPQRMPDPDEPGIDAAERAGRRAAIKSVSRLPERGRKQNLGDVNAEDFVERALLAGGGRPPDVLVFGSPCQDFSVAGGRLGLDGARGNMALVALNVARKLGVRWLAFENVPGLLSSYSGGAETASRVQAGAIGGRAEADEDSDFAAFLAAVQQCGYLGGYRITDAQFAGVPQRRRRVFAIFHLGDWRPAAAVLFEPESLRGDRPPGRETGQRVAPTPEARANGGGAGWGTDFMSDGGLATADEAIAGPLGAGDGKRGWRNDLDQGAFVVAGAVSSKWAKGTGGPAGDECYNLVANPLRAQAQHSHREDNDTVVVHTLRGDGFDASEDGTGRAIAFTAKDHGADVQVEQAPTLRAMGHDGSHANGGGQLAVAFQRRIARNGRGQPDDVVPALNGADAGATSDMRPCVAAGAVVRRLTPIECERLQSFPDRHTLVKFNGKWAADGPRYKALGNAMNVAEIGWYLRRIELFEQTIGVR